MFSVNYNIHERTVADFLKALRGDDVKSARDILDQIKAKDPGALPAILSIPCGKIYMDMITIITMAIGGALAITLLNIGRLNL